MIRSLSAAVIPFILLAIILYGWVKKVDIFDAFLSGAAGGIKTLFGILPALVGLITAIAMFRQSGALNFFTGLLSPLTSRLGIPPEIMPLALMRPISGSGALAIANDLITVSGPDSATGRMASVLMGSAETTFYTLAVYYGAVKIKETRHTVPAALLADAAGLLAGCWVCHLFFT